MKIKLTIILLALCTLCACSSQRYIATNTDDEELVNTGYGKILKRNSAGATANVKVLDRNMEFDNIYDYLRGNVAGLDVDGSTSGGSIPTIRIRGVNSINGPNDPLVIVDGAYDSVAGIASINPNDVASIDVLKDASMTAAYGSRGSGGVIIINLKKGGE